MKIDFNNDWIFYKENGEKTPVTLPHDAMLAETRRPDAAAGTNNGYFPGGVYTYEKRFTVAEADADKSFVLHFEGVYGNTSVFINGKIAARHRYGYTAFDADLTGLAKTRSPWLRITHCSRIADGIRAAASTVRSCCL